MTRRSRTSFLVVVTAIIAIIAVSAATSGGAQKKASGAKRASSAISVRQTPTGKVLVAPNGRTLYLFALDRHNSSRLSAAGRAVWPLFTATTLPAASNGASASRIGRISASKQVTYAGHPLYYYVGDQRPGQTFGQGLNEFGARWYVLSASGAAITSAHPSAAAVQPAPSTNEGAGYGY